MKKYLLFAGANYYPNCGVEDFVKDFSTIKEAKEYFWKNKKSVPCGGSLDIWGQIVSYKTMKEVCWCGLRKDPYTKEKLSSPIWNKLCATTE